MRPKSCNAEDGVCCLHYVQAKATLLQLLCDGVCSMSDEQLEIMFSQLPTQVSRTMIYTNTHRHIPLPMHPRAGLQASAHIRQGKPQQCTELGPA